MENFYIEKEKLIDVEIFLWDDSPVQDDKVDTYNRTVIENKYSWQEEDAYAYVVVNETTPWTETRVIMPRNMFEPTPLGNSGEVFFVIEEDQASVDHSDFQVNYTAGE